MRVEDVKFNPVKVVHTETGDFAGLKAAADASVVQIVEEMRGRECNCISLLPVIDERTPYPSVTCFRENDELLIFANKGTELDENGVLTKKIRISPDSKVSILS